MTTNIIYTTKIKSQEMQYANHESLANIYITQYRRDNNQQ